MFDFVIFPIQTLVKDILLTKPLELKFTQNNITFTIVLALASMSANWHKWQFWLATKFLRDNILRKQKVQGLGLAIAHVYFTCKHILHSVLEMVAFKML